MEFYFSGQDCVFFLYFCTFNGEISSIYNAFPIIKATLVWYLSVTQTGNFSRLGDAKKRESDPLLHYEINTSIQGVMKYKNARTKKTPIY